MTDQLSAMRGVDYRAKSKGIVLIVARPFENFRDAEQALHRVGRFGDSCSRYKLKGFDIVNNELAQRAYSRMFCFVHSRMWGKPTY